jgi:hypothetical protein
MTQHVFGGPLAEKDFAMLEACGIPRELAKEAAGRVDSFTGAEMFGRNGSSGNYAGVIYTNSLPGQDQPREYTLRRDHPDLEVGGDGKVKEKAKYINPPGRSNLLYFAPHTAPEWLEDTTLPLIITEGPKKCLALSHLAWNGVSDATNKPRWLAVALSGVWNWRGTVCKTDGPDGERQDIKGPIPDLSRIQWMNREIVILFDNDARVSSSVSKARNNLAGELRKRVAHVKFVDIPEVLGAKGIDDVIGDDVIGCFGQKLALRLIDKAYDPKKKRIPANRPKPSLTRFPRCERSQQKKSSSWFPASS